MIGLLSVSSDALARIGVVKVAETKEKETINEYEDNISESYDRVIGPKFSQNMNGKYERCG